MKRYWTAGAVALAAMLVASGCNDYGNTFQGNTGAQLSSLSPSNIPAGSGDTTITVNGGGFVAQTVVEWNSQKLKTTITLDANSNVTLVTAVVPANLLAMPGKALVFTQNPFSGAGNNGLSNTITFIVNNPPNKIPAITNVTAGAVVAAGLPITITGTDFLNSSTDPSQVSTVNFSIGGQQTNITPTGTAITATQIQATIPAALLGTVGCGSITVFNPASPPVPNLPGSVGSGGGNSNQWAIAIGGGTCPAAAAKKSSAAAAASSGVAEETPAVSADGRYVAYSATQNDNSEIFVRDTCVGAASGCQARTILVSTAADGTAANGNSLAPSMSADGRYVAFSSAATNLAANLPSSATTSSSAGRQIYLRDTCLGADPSCKASTQLISTDPEGALVGAEAILPSVSSSGRFVAFLAMTPSHATNPAQAQNNSAAGANSGFRQVFVRDTCMGAANCTPKTSRISLLPGDGSDATGKPAGPAISGNASRVAAPGAKAATLFTHSVAVDDSIFLAATKGQN